jgi:hypothetical protein
MRRVTLTETEARGLFRRCVWLSLVPLCGCALALALLGFQTSLPVNVMRPLAVVAMAAIVGGDFYFCRNLGRLANGLGQSGPHWVGGVWVASKFMFCVAWWLALLKIRRVMSRAYAPPVVPIFPR